MKSLSMIVIVLSLVFFSAAAAQTGASVWTAEKQLAVKTVGSPRVSPDGRRIAYTVNEPLMTLEKSEFVTQIWMAATDGSGNRQITFGEKSSTNPRWSLDGSCLAFTSHRKDGKNNIYILQMVGGEAEPLTDVKSSISDFKWSPDNRSMAFTMADPKTEEEEKNDKAKNDFRWFNENLKMNRLYIVPIAKDSAGKREPKLITAQDCNITDFNWSPDGTRLVYSHTKTPGANDWTTSDISVIEIKSGEVASIARTSAAELAPCYSPDGKSIALLCSDDPPRWARDTRIQIYSIVDGQIKTCTATFDNQPTMVGWSADGQRIYFSEAKKTCTSVYALNIKANKIEEIQLSPAVLNAVDLNPSACILSYARQNSATPPEIYVSSLAGLKTVQISKANADLNMAVGKTRVIQWKSNDGKEIEGLLTLPVGYQSGKIPLLLNIHGGPAGVFQQTFIGNRGLYPLATLAWHGYAILCPNPRGSSGYGLEFRRANLQDWGGGDYQDIMTGVDKVIEMGIADPEKLGVMGWSYGGFMTAWIVTQTHRFKAASSGAPVTNLMSFNGTADIPSFIPDYFGGQFWEVLERYQKHSPMFNVKGVTTPTMIQHGEADVRVPISQGYEFYHALKAQGVATRMLVLPRQPHGPNEPKMQLTVMQSNLEWFEKYLPVAEKIESKQP